MLNFLLANYADILLGLDGRGVLALITAFVVTLLIAPWTIQRLAYWQRSGVTVREDVPDTHQQKIGTPSMGGLILVTSTMLSVLCWADWGNGFVWAILCLFFAFAGIGFIDDYVKIRRASKGISGKSRLALEGALALAFVLWVQSLQAEQAYVLVLPLLKQHWDIGYLMIPLAVLVIVGTANAVNLTDGLDGLAIMSVMVAVICFSVIALVVGLEIWSIHTNNIHLDGVAALVVVGMALIGAGMGFLWFNAPPAKIFMGDTGSLALGGMLGGFAVVTKQEIMLVLIGGVFVAETFSVIAQVAWFKLYGKRIFAMAPLHHHFEKKGWPETTVVIRFWIVSLLLGSVGLSLFL